MGRLRRPYGPLNGVLLFYSFSGYTGSIRHRTFRHSRDGRIDASTVSRWQDAGHCSTASGDHCRFYVSCVLNFPGSWRSCVNSMLQRTVVWVQAFVSGIFDRRLWRLIPLNGCPFHAFLFSPKAYVVLCYVTTLVLLRWAASSIGSIDW